MKPFIDHASCRSRSFRTSFDAISTLFWRTCSPINGLGLGVVGGSGEGAAWTLLRLLGRLDEGIIDPNRDGDPGRESSD